MFRRPAHHRRGALGGRRDPPPGRGQDRRRDPASKRVPLPLSHLTECAECGGHMAIVNKGRYGCINRPRTRHVRDEPTHCRRRAGAAYRRRHRRLGRERTGLAGPPRAGRRGTPCRPRGTGRRARQDRAPDRQHRLGDRRGRRRSQLEPAPARTGEHRRPAATSNTGASLDRPRRAPRHFRPSFGTASAALKPPSPVPVPGPGSRGTRP